MGTYDAVRFSKRTGRVRDALRAQSTDPNPDPSPAELEAAMRANCPAGADVVVVPKAGLPHHQLAATLATGKRPRELHHSVAEVLDGHPIASNAQVVEDRYCVCAADGTVLATRHLDPDCGDSHTHFEGGHHLVLHATAREGDKI